jgi:hypothetical protein
MVRTKRLINKKNNLLEQSFADYSFVLLRDLRSPRKKFTLFFIQILGELIWLKFKLFYDKNDCAAQLKLVAVATGLS